jgi:hypothetical protein
MHNKRIGRDDLLKIEWARTPPSASWRFDSHRVERGSRRISPRRRSLSPTRRDSSPLKDRDHDRDRRDRSKSPDSREVDRDREKARSGGFGDGRDNRFHNEIGADDMKVPSPAPNDNGSIE